MKIEGNNNHVNINSHNTKIGWTKKKRITIISILTIISLLIGIYKDIHLSVIKFFDRTEPSLNYDHTTFGSDLK